MIYKNMAWPTKVYNQNAQNRTETPQGRKTSCYIAVYYKMEH